jgi:hypothetical protein
MVQTGPVLSEVQVAHLPALTELHKAASVVMEGAAARRIRMELLEEAKTALVAMEQATLDLEAAPAVHLPPLTVLQVDPKMVLVAMVEAEHLLARTVLPVVDRMVLVVDRMEVDLKLDSGKVEE